jgi:hypothetical protein
LSVDGRDVNHGCDDVRVNAHRVSLIGWKGADAMLSLSFANRQASTAAVGKL